MIRMKSSFINWPRTSTPTACYISFLFQIWEELCPLVRAACEELSKAPNLLLPATEYTDYNAHPVDSEQSLQEWSQPNSSYQRYLVSVSHDIILPFNNIRCDQTEKPDHLNYHHSRS